MDSVRFFPCVPLQYTISVIYLCCCLFVANYREAALAVFSYLSLLRSSALEPWHQKEFSQLLHTRFRFAEKSRPDDYAVWMTEQMAWPTPRELVVKAPQVVWEWDEAGEAEKEVRRTLEGLRVAEGRAVLMGRKEEHVKVGGEGEWENEPWYGTEYKVVKMDEEFVRLVSFRHCLWLCFDSYGNLCCRRMVLVPFRSCTFLDRMSLCRRI